jgi:hypothetical protein
MRLHRTVQSLPDSQPDAGERRSPAPQVERHLLRRSVDGLTAERARCSDCGRTPLIGEDLHLYEGGLIVCELCRQLRHTAPVHTEVVLHSEAGHSVRVRRRASASPPLAPETMVREPESPLEAG